MFSIKTPAPKQFHIVIEAAEKTEKSISGQPFFRYRKTRRFLLDFLEKSEQNSFHFEILFPKDHSRDAF